MVKTRKRKLPFKGFFISLLIIILALLSGVGIDIVIRPSEGDEIVIDTSFSLRLSDKQIPAKLETEEGEVEDTDIVTVEEVESNDLREECEEGEECGLGYFVYAPTDTPLNFKNYTYGGCWDTDGHFSAQCWDLADLFWQNYAGRNFSTCGTGAAKGSWNCKEQNAGDDFELIYDKHELELGDWIIFSSGQYGHVGMAMGDYNNGYIALLGQNQGGASCVGGGAAANIINISLKSFVGAFRPKTYAKDEPTPIPVSGCELWHVKKGDTMSRIMLECEGTVKYGEAMNNYAKSWYSVIFKPGQSVYDGWHSRTGVGLYAGDDIEHKVK